LLASFFLKAQSGKNFASKMQDTDRKSAKTGDSPFTDKYYLQIIYRSLINRLSSLFTDPNISFTKFYSPLA